MASILDSMRGDRLAVYIGASRMILRLSKLTPEGLFFFDGNDNPGHLSYLAHPKQCRRLKPKKRREFWIKLGQARVSDNEIISAVGPIILEHKPPFGLGDFIHVKECAAQKDDRP